MPSIHRLFAFRRYIGTIGRMARRGDTIELAVLGLLHEGPMHGYELRKRLNLMLGWGRILSYGSLYPALKKMLRNNLIEELRSEEHTSELQSLMRTSYAVFCLKK